ncbi:hypothetical protein GPECTOR_2g970 [Gonium pectorale]|uniref:Uncharacterized protein n=1 Tax=Gonium pectorale TaxID=33097 RepID=A0A150H2M3_GONPE|nr:hypothetical protein GPECTOR_2g970 [Gonium pectorale]|eukprot:KXZ56088.1 hypothetical protein GPECTOR_2g970 [Gonium pectorale]
MVGVAVAVAIEALTDRSIFLAVNGDTALTYAAIGLATVATAAGIALARGGTSTLALGTGMDLLEAVIASLTAVRRSAAGVTQTQVDKAVDYLLETVLDNRFDSFSIDGLLLSDEDA